MHGPVGLPIEDVLATKHADDAKNGSEGQESRKAFREAAIRTGPVRADDRVDRGQYQTTSGHHREEDEVRVKGQPRRLRIGSHAANEGDDADDNRGETDVEEWLGQYARISPLCSRCDSAHYRPP